MALVPSSLQRAGREHPLITLGIVMAVLIVALLALPFIARPSDPGPAGSLSAAETAPR